MTNDGLRNLRDLGGLPTSDGRRVRYGRVFRAAAPCRLSVSDARQLEALGLRSTVDLRDQAEVDESPTSLPDGLRCARSSIREPVDVEGRGLVAQVLAGSLLDFTPADLAGVYVSLLEEQPQAFGIAITHMAQPCNVPVLVHCRAGRDRTGLLLALLLDALAVERSAILDDYEASRSSYPAPPG